MKQIPYPSTIARMIIFNKIEGIPAVENTRPIATLSPLIKIFELLLKPKLKKLADNSLYVKKS